MKITLVLVGLFAFFLNVPSTFAKDDMKRSLICSTPSTKKTSPGDKFKKYILVIIPSKVDFLKRGQISFKVRMIMIDQNDKVWETVYVGSGEALETGDVTLANHSLDLIAVDNSEGLYLDVGKINLTIENNMVLRASFYWLPDAGSMIEKVGEHPLECYFI